MCLLAYQCWSQHVEGLLPTGFPHSYFHYLTCKMFGNILEDDIYILGSFSFSLNNRSTYIQARLAMPKIGSLRNSIEISIHSKFISIKNTVHYVGQLLALCFKIQKDKYPLGGRKNGQEEQDNLQCTLGYLIDPVQPGLFNKHLRH